MIHVLVVKSLDTKYHVKAQQICIMSFLLLYQHSESKLVNPLITPSCRVTFLCIKIWGKKDKWLKSVAKVAKPNKGKCQEVEKNN